MSGNVSPPTLTVDVCFCLREKWGDLWLKLILRQVSFSSPTGTSAEEAKVAFFFFA